MHKIGVIARYEILMAWRRRSLVILLLVLVLTSLAFAVVVAAHTQTYGTLRVDATTARIAAENGWSVDELVLTTQLTNHIGLLALVVNITLVLFCAETIPLDRQFKVRELLDTLPISRATYLGGKVIGACGGLGLIILVGGAVSLIAQRVILGAYHIPAIAVLWLLLVLPLVWANGAVSVMAAAFWGSRRIALLFSLLLLPLHLVLLWAGFMHLSYARGLADPAYLMASTSLTMGQDVNAEMGLHVGFGLALLAGVTLVVWTITWALLRLLDAR